MSPEFFLSSDSFAWTNRGLLKADEIKKGDKILGLDGSGRVNYQDIRLAKKTKESRIVRAASNKSETCLYEKQRVIKLGGPCPICNLVEGNDKLELCLKPAFFDNVKRMFENRPNLISPSFAYLLGRTKTVRFEDDSNRLAFHFDDWSRLNRLATIFHETHQECDIDTRGKIYRGPSSSTKHQYVLVIKSSQLINLLNDVDPTADKIPIEVRSSTLECLKSYLNGLIDTFAIFYKKSVKIGIKRQQSELRRFLYNVFPLFGIVPKKTRWSYKVFLEIEKNDLDKFECTNTLSKSKRFYLLKKLDKFRQKSIIKLKTTSINWSPVIDLLLLESR